MRTSLLSLACLISVSSTGFAAFSQVDVSYLNDFGTGPRPPIEDSTGTTLNNGDVYQVVIWGNVGLTPADAGWDWYDYTAISGDGSSNPSLMTMIGGVNPGEGAPPNGLGLFSQSVTFDDSIHNDLTGAGGSRIGLVFFDNSTRDSSSFQAGLFDPSWTLPAFTDPVSSPNSISLDASFDGGNMVWQGAPFTVNSPIPEPTSGLLALLGSLLLLRRRR